MQRLGLFLGRLNARSQVFEYLTDLKIIEHMPKKQMQRNSALMVSSLQATRTGIKSTS